jgi:urease subunit gamma/beta
MQIGPTEQARLVVFQLAQLARHQRDRGLLLNAPEAIALACDEMHLAARAGCTYEEVAAAGLASVAPGELLDGVATLIGEIRLEVLLNEGTRLIVLRGLGSAATAHPEQEPGATVLGPGVLTINEGLASLELEVANDSDHPVRVSSHYPFDRVNPRLTFDRAAARGARLDIPAGDTVRWGPGERKVVRLVHVPAPVLAGENEA